jgi:hypothetical protein
MILTTEPSTIPAVRYEPCAQFLADDPDGDTCSSCGWLADDHVPVAAGITSRAAA